MMTDTAKRGFGPTTSTHDTTRARARPIRIARDAIIAALQGFGKPVTTLEVAVHFGERTNYISARLSELAAYGFIARTKHREWVGGNFIIYCLWSPI